MAFLGDRSDKPWLFHPSSRWTWHRTSGDLRLCRLGGRTTEKVVGSLTMSQPGRENGSAVDFRAELFSDDFPTHIWSSLKLPLKEQDSHSQ